MNNIIYISVLVLFLSLSGFSVVNMTLLRPLHAQTEKEQKPDMASGPAAVIYRKNCASCHDRGIMGAPKPGEPRLLGDIDTLVANAIKGIGNMPARGHAAFLSDDEVRSVVEYMTSPPK